MKALAPRFVSGAATLTTLALLTSCGQVTVESPSGEGGGSPTPTRTIKVVDDVDRTVTLDGPVDRAVVLNSYGNEFVRAIGAGDRVVGVDRTSSKRLPYLDITDNEIVSENLSEINYEAVVKLDPDVVIIPRNGAWEEAAAQLKSFDIPVVVATAWDFDVFHETIDLLGKVFDQPEGAKAVSGFYDEIFETVESRVKGATRVPVYWETEQPYLTVLPGSGFDQIITAAGGRNVFGDVKTGGDVQSETTVDPAEVVKRDPALIIHEFGPSATPTGQKQFDSVRDDLLGRPGWKSTRAEKTGQVYVSNGWATSGLSKAIGALYLATWLHPDKFADVDPESYLKRWVEDFQRTEFKGGNAYIQKVATAP
ncbi:ABC transporter substrate-binding protein [Actinopolymorpha alba]|uniref:ABC transporter substrate-binding protein n=1 Tax=Actinopolymorpha alba TaxID=533267 RepID=UPI00036B5E9E|nr:ABC transporter substrate-binding protein [Actinopolymorpha alba]